MTAAASTLSDFMSALDSATSMADGATTNPQYTYDIDRATIRANLTAIGDVDVASLLTLAAKGHTWSILADESGVELEMRGDADPRGSVTLSGDPGQIVESEQADSLSRAVSRQDVLEVSNLVRDLPAVLTISVRNHAILTGWHWIHSGERLGELLTGPLWTAAASNLTRDASVVVVQNAGSSILRTPYVWFVGPGALEEALRGSGAGQPTQSDAEYRERVSSSGRPALPSPLKFEVVPSILDGTFIQLARILHGVARSLVWYWLATEVEISGGNVNITLVGARVVLLELRPTPTDGALADVLLYRWAVSGADPARMEALYQASSLAVLSERDLPTAATPVLRTAQSLYELTRRGSVAEALAARRAAREAVLNSARQAAQSARQAAGKAVERLLVQTAAAIAVILSNAGGIIARAASVWLLLAIAAVSIASLVVTLRIELASAEGGLNSEVSDLDQYRDTLAEEDIAAMKKVNTLSSARDDLRRTRRTVTLAYGVAALAIPLIGFILVQSGAVGSTGRPPPSPRPTVVSPRPASSGPSLGPTRTGRSTRTGAAMKTP
jgi:hypothetical protein